MKIVTVAWAFSIILFIALPVKCNANTEIKGFLNTSFEEIPKPKRIWIDKKKQIFIKNHINPSQIKLSYRYWQKNNKFVWVLDEIGKERNITTGIVIINNAIQSVQIITYRESRGYQVQSDRFTHQYQNKTISNQLTKEIDSISGATLSVIAINKQVKLALYLNSQI